MTSEQIEVAYALWRAAVCEWAYKNDHMYPRVTLDRGTKNGGARAVFIADIDIVNQQGVRLVVSPSEVLHCNGPLSTLVESRLQRMIDETSTRDGDDAIHEQAATVQDSRQQEEPVEGLL